RIDQECHLISKRCKMTGNNGRLGASFAVNDSDTSVAKTAADLARPGLVKRLAEPYLCRALRNDHLLREQCLWRPRKYVGDSVGQALHGDRTVCCPTRHGNLSGFELREHRWRMGCKDELALRDGPELRRAATKDTQETANSVRLKSMLKLIDDPQTRRLRCFVLHCHSKKTTRTKACAPRRNLAVV